MAACPRHDLIAYSLVTGVPGMPVINLRARTN
jgi:hypothetical protein